MTKLHTTVITACRNRNEYLAQALPSWLRHDSISEIFIFDMRDKSCERAYDVVRQYDDTRLTVIETEYEYLFSLSMAYNALLPWIHSPFTLKIDSDIVLHPDYFKHHAMTESGNVMYGMNGSGTFGTFYMPTHPLVETGFNENILLYGYDDNYVYEIFKREYGLNIKPHNLEFLTHIKHPNIKSAYGWIKVPENYNEAKYRYFLNECGKFNQIIMGFTQWDSSMRIKWLFTQVADNLYRAERGF